MLSKEIIRAAFLGAVANYQRILHEKIAEIYEISGMNPTVYIALTIFKDLEPIQVSAQLSMALYIYYTVDSILQRNTFSQGLTMRPWKVRNMSSRNMSTNSMKIVL